MVARRRSTERAAALDRLSDLIEAERDSLVALLASGGRQDPRRRRRRGARGGRLLPLLRRRGAAAFRRRRDRCRARPARATCSAIADAASSSASRRGTSRWRSSSARSPRRSPPATRSSPSPPSRRRSSPSAPSGFCTRRECRRRRRNWRRATATIGAALVAHPDVAGVAFTGSTEVAALINRALAAKNGPIVPLIAETGGINAMIVDATALPEQVADDVVASAFRSAGQRCSALRLLCLQEDVADRMLAMIEGAAAELVARRPARSRDRCRAGHRRRGEGEPREPRRRDADSALCDRPLRRRRRPRQGTFVAPHIIELDGPGRLTREVFGPILHVVALARRQTSTR